MELKIKDMLLFDNKHCMENRFNEDGQQLSHIERIMKSYLFFQSIKGEKDYEAREFAQAFYYLLRWNKDTYGEIQRYYDVINSFWLTFSYGFPYIDNETYHITDFGNVRKVYKRRNKKYPNLPSFPEKYICMDQKTRRDVLVLCEKFPISDFAELCHCVANFMPCPGDNYNSAKGCFSDVQDYLPLMINKIQYQVDNNNGDFYTVNNKKECVTADTFKVWQKWFIDNRENYLLEDYYYIDKGSDEKIKLIGIPLFLGQSLSNPIPRTEKEVKECLDNILRIIKHRALKMDNRIKELNLDISSHGH